MGSQVAEMSAEYLVDSNEKAIPVGYKQTEVGVIPEDWAIEPLEKFTSFISYGFTNPMPTSGSGPYMITARDISNGKIQYEKARKTDFRAFNTILTGKSKPQKNDLLLTKDGTLGRLALVKSSGICINQSVAILRPNSRIVPIFFKLLLESEQYQNKMIEDAGGSTIKHIYITIVNKMLIGVPKKHHEQTLIANALSDVDALLHSLEKLIAKKQAIKTATMQQLLTGRTRLPEFAFRDDGTRKGYKESELGEVPEDWYIDSLGNLLSITTGSKNTQDRMEDGTYPFFVRSQTIERINSYSFNGEAILTAGDGVGTGKIFHYINGKFDFHQRVYLMYNFGERIDGYFFYIYFSNNFYDRIMSMTAKSSVDSVRREMIADMKMLLPSQKEQTAIASILSDMDTEIQNLEQRLAKTRQIKQGMMQELLTGKTRLIKGKKYD